MSVRITTREQAVLYDSVNGIAFGPVFDSQLEASDFVEWLPKDARIYTSADLVELYVDFQERDGDLSDTARLGAGA